MKFDATTISKAVRSSAGQMDHFRRARGIFLTQMVGRFYRRGSVVEGEESHRASPLNMLFTAVTTMVPNLVFNYPRVKVRTNILPYRNYAGVLELATNHLIEKIDFRETLRKAVFDSIFLAGFIKTGLADAEDVIVSGGDYLALGQPFADRVDPDDMIIDPWARDWNEQSFVGNRFRADLDDLQATGLYDSDELEKLAKRDSVEEKRYASRVDGKDVDLEFSEVRRFVDLCEVYIPSERVIVTLPFSLSGDYDKFLRVAEYDGPGCGPYHMLGYTPVSDNVLPVAPAAIWYDLHQMGNRIARKMARQAERMKRVLAYTDEARDSVEDIADAEDGETVRVTDVNQVREVGFGGTTNDAYEWMEWVKRQFSEQANSMDLLSGTGASAPTATQASMLQANGSVRMADMQEQVYSFVAKVARDLAYYLHTDPLIDLPLVRRRAGQEEQVHFTADQSAKTFFEYTFKTEPYSMARPDPAVKVRRILEFATSVIPAAAQAAQMLGPGFRVGEFLTSLAKEMPLDEVDEWLDDPAIRQWIEMKVQMSMTTGEPGKAGSMMTLPPSMFNPAQPVPMATGPSGGISPRQETSAVQQEASAPSQSSSRQVSVGELANQVSLKGI